MWCRHLTCFSLEEELVGRCSHKATRTITLKIASLKIIILKIPFHILLLYISSCLSVIHPDSHFDTLPLLSMSYTAL